MYLRYLALAVVAAVVIVINFVLAPVIPFFVNADGYLPKWLAWFQTQDAPAIGDQMFHDREMAFAKSYPAWEFHYLCALLWAMRNPGYGFMQLHGLTVREIRNFTNDGPDVDIGDAGYRLGRVIRTCEQDGKRYFDFKAAGKWNDRYGWMVQFGWSLNGIQSDPIGTKRSLKLEIRPRIALVEDV